MIYKGKEYLLPEKESLAYIPAGASVIPHNELMNAAGVSTMTPLPKYNYAGILGLSREEAIMLNRELVKTIKNKRETHITFDRHGFSAAAHEGANWEYYLNNRIRL